jgi:succinoglycan biosynthesis protein ExoM
MNPCSKHISVCICTYKRPLMLKRLLMQLETQESDGLFTFSAVVADNDREESAKPIVEEAMNELRMAISYCVEPRQNIALARNRAIKTASGNFIAFIDDDEFPIPRWLVNLYTACQEYGVDGVLGPVLPHFEAGTPTWVRKGSFYKRPIYPTGLTLNWRKGRTGNVLLKRDIVPFEEPAFREEFRAGEDQDFFRRMMDLGYRFVWSADAIVYESVPPFRCRRSVMLRRALLRGASAALQPTVGALSVAKSVLAIVIYVCALPAALLLGQHRLMTLLVKLCDHLGKLLALLGINPIKEQYVTE